MPTASQLAAEAALAACSARLKQLTDKMNAGTELDAKERIELASLSDRINQHQRVLDAQRP